MKAAVLSLLLAAHGAVASRCKPALATTSTAAAASPTCTNILTNGDFSDGLTG